MNATANYTIERIRQDLAIAAGALLGLLVNVLAVVVCHWL